VFYRIKVDRVLSSAVEVFSARHASAAKYSRHVSNRPKYPNRPSELNPSDFFVRTAIVWSCAIDKELREQSRSQRSEPFTWDLIVRRKNTSRRRNWASLWIALINDSTDSHTSLSTLPLWFVSSRTSLLTCTLTSGKYVTFNFQDDILVKANKYSERKWVNGKIIN